MMTQQQLALLSLATGISLPNLASAISSSSASSSSNPNNTAPSINASQAASDNSSATSQNGQAQDVTLSGQASAGSNNAQMNLLVAALMNKVGIPNMSAQDIQRLSGDSSTSILNARPAHSSNSRNLVCISFSLSLCPSLEELACLSAFRVVRTIPARCLATSADSPRISFILYSRRIFSKTFPIMN